jgi:hypothetical protein
VGTAAAIALIAAVAMFDSRDVFAASRGNAPGDVGAHFYPFWAAALMGLAAVAVAYRALTTPQAAEGVFTGRTSIFAVLKLVIPMVLAAAAILWLGIYIVTALYMGLYARWLGRYNWIWVGVIAIAFPLTIYLAFEVGFRAILPKSIFYSSGLPF